MIVPVNTINSVLPNNRNKINRIPSNNVVSIEKSNNVTRISFKGKFNNPEIPSIQMKVRGVTKHQKTMTDEKQKRPMDNNIDKLAESNWQDGKRLFPVYKYIGGEERILLYDPDFGEIGRVPDEIAKPIKKLLKQDEKGFEFQLSNVIAGTTKGAATIGLRVNLLCKSKNKKVRNQAKNIFYGLLNSKSKDISEEVMFYQPKTAPHEVLGRIFDVTNEKRGTKGVKEIKQAINTISSAIDNPFNKKILLVGHNVPDGDTIGCVLGMDAAIRAAYPDKTVDCSIDDNIPGLFRSTLPGIEKIKKPDELNKKTNYDLVILMDIPSPSRFTGAYKEYLQNAKDVIYIDHHPYKYEEWESSKEETGVDVEKIQAKNMGLIVPEVPAAAELVTILANNKLMLNKTMKNLPLAKQYVAATATGISTDTGCFNRTANLTPEDIQKPVQKRPDFRPEGLTKWLIDQIGKSINKKWLRENIVYDIPDKGALQNEKSAREKMVDYAGNAKYFDKDLGLGFINITYKQMYDIWKTAKEKDKDVTFLDVQNSIKYSEIMGSLRESDLLNKNNNNKRINKDKLSIYDEDKIAVLMVQDKKKGMPDDKGQIAETSGIRMSFRSQEGTIYAELLASLFNGGGHGAAAGGRIDGNNISYNSNFAIKINGKIIKDYGEIYEKLMENYTIKHNPNISEKDKKQYTHNISVIPNQRGENLQSIITNMTAQIRMHN